MLPGITGKHWRGFLVSSVLVVVLVLAVLYCLPVLPALQVGNVKQVTPVLSSPVSFPVASSSTAPLVMDTGAITDHLAGQLETSSLRGTDVDRPVIRLLDGKLVLNGTLLFYFDYFLSLEGEMSLADIRQWVASDLRSAYTEPVAVQILDIFNRYVAYLEEVAETEAAITADEITTQHLSAADMQNAARHNYFSTEEIAALFGNYDDLLGSPSRASVQQAAYEGFRQAIKDNPAQFDSVATELFGAQAAQNLRNVQYARQQWEGRLANYRREKHGLELAYPGDAQGLQQAVTLLRQRMFSEPEIRRIKSLERQGR